MLRDLEYSKVKRRLRIAVSIFFALLAVAFAVLWVRSYQNLQGASWKTKQGSFVIAAINGRLAVWSYEYKPPNRAFDSSYTGVRDSPLHYLDPDDWGANFESVRSPIWFLVLAAATFAAIPWLKWRFSLRTLLIATTLVAVVLGLIVWAAKR